MPVLHFSRNEINGERRNLSRQREIVSAHRARFIQEAQKRRIKPEEAEHLERIEIVEGKG